MTIDVGMNRAVAALEIRAKRGTSSDRNSSRSDQAGPDDLWLIIGGDRATWRGQKRFRLRD